MHGTAAWREWCALERCLVDDTLACLAKVQIVSHACHCMWGITYHFRSNSQVYTSGQMVAVKVKLFKTYVYDMGLQSDYQVAMLANLSSFFKV